MSGQRAHMLHSGKPGFESWLCHCLAIWFWTSHLVSLCFHFLILKIKEIMVSDSRWLWAIIHLKTFNTMFGMKAFDNCYRVIVKIKWEISSVKHPDWLTVHDQHLVILNSCLFVYSFFGRVGSLLLRSGFLQLWWAGVAFVALLGLPIAVVFMATGFQ